MNITRRLNFIVAVLTVIMIGSSLLSTASYGDTLEEGYQAYIKTDFSGAREKLINAAKNESSPVKLTKIYKLLGIVYYMLSDLNEAARAFKLSLSYNPQTTISASEVLDETIITFFNRIKTLETTSVDGSKDDAKKKKKGKKKYRYVKKRRPLKSMEMVYAALPFGSGQIMHEQYFYGAMSGTLQAVSLGYLFLLNDKIDKSKARENAAYSSGALDDDVKVIISGQEKEYRKKQQTYQQIAFLGFAGLWAVSSVDAFLTPKYKRFKRRVYEEDEEASLLKGGYDIKLGLAPNMDNYSPDLLLNFETRF